MFLVTPSFAALTATVTKVSVNIPQLKLYIITLNLKVSDGVTNVIDQNFTQEYRTGESVAGIVNKFQAQMQDVIDKYKLEKSLLDNAQLNTAITNITGGLVL